MLVNNQPTISTVLPTENTYVDGILWDGERWATNTISYSFNSGSTLKKTLNWTDTEIAVVEQGLATWSSVADLEFVRVADDNPNATLKFNLGNNFTPGLSAGLFGFFNPPGFQQDPGTGYLNWSELGGVNFANLKPGDEGFAWILHEIGHGLGLAHPHDNGGNSNLYPGLNTISPESSTGIYGLNQGVWTIMSYNRGFDGFGAAGTPMSFDIAAIQHLYGANENYAVQGNVYQLPTNSVYYSIWDTGGIDIISASNATSSATIDLRPASLVGANAGGFISSAANVNGGFTIANEVVIEDAEGSSYDDVLMGNQRANILTAGGGTDSLIGGEGADTLTGVDTAGLSPGYSEYDILTGGAGADTFVLGSSSGAYYQDFGFATITDFDWMEGDKVQVFGTSGDYTIEDTGNSTDIYFQDDLIGNISNTSDVVLSLDFDFV